MKPVARATAALALGAVAIFLLPAVAECRPWRVHTLATHTQTFHRGVDALPDGRTAVLLQRRVARRNHLELRIGRSIRTLDVTSHNFDSTKIDHDDKGRLVVAWARIASGGGSRRAFVWTTGGKRRAVSVGNEIVSWLSLDVAGDGHAALAIWSNEGVSIARRRPGGRFRAPEFVASKGTFRSSPGVPTIGIARGGRTVVVWEQGEGLMARASRGDGPLGRAYPIPLQPPSAGLRLIMRVQALAMTSAGRAVVASSSFEAPPRDVLPVVSQRVEAFDWARDAAAPSPARVISQAPFASDPAVLARNEVAIIAWKEATTLHRGTRVLRAIVWGSTGPAAPTAYRPGLDLGSLYEPLELSALPGRAARLFYPTSRGVWHTVRLTRSGSYREHSRVTPPGHQVANLAADAIGDRSLALWTVKLGRGNASYRVQIGRPPARRQ